jgi:hypothetical protein
MNGQKSHEHQSNPRNMRKIKTLIGLSVAGLLAAASPLLITTVTVAPVAMTGCTTLNNTNNTAQIDATALILKNAARLGAVAAITPPNGNTNNAAYFQLASQAIGAFLTGTDYSPAAFQKALIDVKAPGSDNVWVQLGVGTVIDLYQVYFGQYVKGQVNGNFAAVTFLTSIQSGFNEALAVAGVQPPTVAASSLQPKQPQQVEFQILPRPMRK